MEVLGFQYACNKDIHQHWFVGGLWWFTKRSGPYRRLIMNSKLTDMHACVVVTHHHLMISASCKPCPKCSITVTVLTYLDQPWPLWTDILWPVTFSQQFTKRSVCCRHLWVIISVKDRGKTAMWDKDIKLLVCPFDISQAISIHGCYGSAHLTLLSAQTYVVYV